MGHSPFLDESRWLDATPLVVTVNQIGYEVSPGHCLIVPKRIIPTVWEMWPSEWMDCFVLLERAKLRLDASHNPDGYNIGSNCGEVAGQTIMHAHIHLIPRYKGDHPNPKGGVRAVIPNKADWTTRECVEPLKKTVEHYVDEFEAVHLGLQEYAAVPRHVHDELLAGLRALPGETP